MDAPNVTPSFENCIHLTNPSVSVAPTSSQTVFVIVYVPTCWYVWFWFTPPFWRVVPSPKSQSICWTVPSESLACAVKLASLPMLDSNGHCTEGGLLALPAPNGVVP